mmetsp:Transcript_106945/g.205701  ORF Transcript_106945/g.205701 Transcript_106945/m.205701 type:complete len:613 (+) Transcript_106945:63-1901(+)
MNLSPHWASPRRQYLLAHAESHRYQPALATARSTRRDRKRETFASRQEVKEKVRQQKAKDVHPGRSLYIHSRDLEVSAPAGTEASAKASPRQEEKDEVAQIFPEGDVYKSELERVTSQAYERVHYTAVKSGDAVASEFGPRPRPKGGFWQRIAYGGRTKEAEAAPLVDFADPVDVNSRDVLYPEVMTGLGLHAKAILHGHGEQLLASQSREMQCPLPKVVHEPLKPGKELHDSLDELSRDLLRERGGIASLKDWPPPSPRQIKADHAFAREMTSYGEGHTAGAEAHFRSYTGHADWTHPAVQGYNDPVADRYREKKWQHQRTLATPDLNPEVVTELFRRIFSTADRMELLELAPKIVAHSFEARKEDVLRVAVRFGEAARSAQDVGETEQCNALQQAALALISSVASRARDAHGPELPVDALVTMQEVGVGHKIYLDMLLSQIYTWSQRTQAEFPKELAHRAATALSWASTALADNQPAGSVLCLAAGSRRAVADIRKALAECEPAQINTDLLQVLEELISGVARDPDCQPNVAEESYADPSGEPPAELPAEESSADASGEPPADLPLRLTTIDVLESEVIDDHPVSPSDLPVSPSTSQYREKRKISFPMIR